jgi:hypothetical protein
VARPSHQQQNVRQINFASLFPFGIPTALSIILSSPPPALHDHKKKTHNLSDAQLMLLLSVPF